MTRLVAAFALVVAGLAFAAPKLPPGQFTCRATSANGAIIAEGAGATPLECVTDARAKFKAKCEKPGPVDVTWKVSGERTLACQSAGAKADKAPPAKGASRCKAVEKGGSRTAEAFGETVADCDTKLRMNFALACLGAQALLANEEFTQERDQLSCPTKAPAGAAPSGRKIKD